MTKHSVISFYTKNTYYEEEIKGLINSCRSFDQPIDAVGVESRATWNENCHLKPFFIREQLKKKQTPLIWIDADGFITAPLTYFDSIHEDIAVRILPFLPNDHHTKVISATLFIKPTPFAFERLDRWCEISIQKRDVQNDQSSLRDALLPHLDRIHNLPVEYCKIDDLAIDNQIDGIICQTQASRLYRKIIDGEVEDFPFLNALSEKELKHFRMSDSFSLGESGKRK